MWNAVLPIRGLFFLVESFQLERRFDPMPFPSVRGIVSRSPWVLYKRGLKNKHSTFNEILRLREKAERLSRELGID